MQLEDVLAAVEQHPTRLVEITGGAPLEQDEAYPLMESLLTRKYTVMLETGGHVRLDRVPPAVIKIIDVKCPDSGEGHTFCWENIALAAPHDEFKFVIASRKYYEWSRDVVRTQLRGSSNTILFSPAHEELPPRQLAEWVLADGLPVLVQLQIHKYIWGADVRGV
jgi:7-carboxy-7-deazaguanine synthase